MIYKRILRSSGVPQEGVKEQAGIPSDRQRLLMGTRVYTMWNDRLFIQLNCWFQ